MPVNEKRILIIGSEGFIGKNFINYYRTVNSIKQLFMVDIYSIKRKNYYKSNAQSFKKINKIIQMVNADEIYNFAGSFSNNFQVDYLNNVMVTKNILDSVMLNGYYHTKILLNGSAAEYGYIKNYNGKVNENYPLNPISTYGLSKVFQTYLTKTYINKNNLKIYLTRPFNIIGYGISEKLFIGRLINQIEQNLNFKSKIILGNIGNERDYIDIEDVIRAYLKIIAVGKPGEIYNIGSGTAIKISDLLQIFLKLFNLNEDSVEINKKLYKKEDIPRIIADISKLENLNWKPNISLKESVLKIKKSMIGDKGG
jgi:GDP-4-dehydro-6-deoxy-D-mannose reductase